MSSAQKALSKNGRRSAAEADEDSVSLSPEAADVADNEDTAATPGVVTAIVKGVVAVAVLCSLCSHDCEGDVLSYFWMDCCRFCKAAVVSFNRQQGGTKSASSSRSSRTV